MNDEKPKPPPLRSNHDVAAFLGNAKDAVTSQDPVLMDKISTLRGLIGEVGALSDAHADRVIERVYRIVSKHPSRRVMLMGVMMGSLLDFYGAPDLPLLFHAHPDLMRLLAPGAVGVIRTLIQETRSDEDEA